MSEQQRHREPAHPREWKSVFLIEGIIAASLVLLVVGVVWRLGIFTLPTQGIRQGIVVSSLLTLATTIPGTLFGLLMFRRVRKRASSRRVLIGVPTCSGIVGGVVVGGLIAALSLWALFATTCC